MSHELSLAELESELTLELPTRHLMRLRRRRFGHSAVAIGGSVANSNHTVQGTNNPQTVINTGTVGPGGIVVQGNNQNNNTTTQI
jgi:hypothetical protein